jgi:RNA polymerase sigma-70 factor (ECF subfamily)
MTRLEPYQRELTHHAARMLGSGFEAEDAVQETMVRAWNALDRFQGRSQLRSWLYRICTNVCLDMLASQRRRARAGLEASERDSVAPPPSPPGGGPAEVAVARESVRLALMTMLQHLSPKQRAVLILREVLHWSAAEIAELLETSVASVNSALQRARATVRRACYALDATPSSDVDDETRSRLDRYARALETSDVVALTALVSLEA